jgi:conserved hypothetical protein
MHEQVIKTKKQLISTFLLLGIIAITFSVFLKDYSLRELFEALKAADFTYLLAGLGMMLIFISCEAANIWLILKVLGHDAPFRRCFEYSSIGYYFSSITPSASGGQPAQVYYMKQDKIPLTLSSITIFYIVYVYQIVMIILGIAAFLFRFDIAVLFAAKLKILLLIGVIINTGVIFLLFSLMFSSKVVPAILSFLIKAGTKLRLVKKTEKVKKKLEESILSYREKAQLIKQHPFLFLQVFLITLIQLIALNLIPYLVYKSMGYHEDNLLSITACQALLTISVSAIPLPGAEGVTQAGFLQVFGMFFPKKALTYAMLINRIISFYLPLIISFILYVYTHLRTSRQIRKASVMKSVDT